MNEQLSTNAILIILSNVPEDYGLINAKRLVQNKIHDENAVVDIAYQKKQDGQVVKTTIVVQLRKPECEFLLYIYLKGFAYQYFIIV